MGRVVGIAAIALLVLGGCAPTASSSPPPGSSAMPPSGPVATPGAAPSDATAFGPRPTQPPLLEQCRRAVFMQPDGGPRLTDQERRGLQVGLQHEDEGAVYVLYTTGARDITCLAYRIMGFPSLRTFSWGETFPSRLAPDRPLVVGPTGGDSELGSGYAWGAVGPNVARVTITDEAGLSADAVISGSYFLGILRTERCCIFGIVAYDSAGRELGRSR